jgi:hypothetical protein
MEIATQIIVVALPALRPLMKGMSFRPGRRRVPSLKPKKLSSSGASSAGGAQRSYSISQTALAAPPFPTTSAADVEDGFNREYDRHADRRDEYPLVSLAGSESNVSTRRAAEPWEAIELPNYMK